MKKQKAARQYHTSKSNIGMGDNYGSGVRNKVGIARDVTTAPRLSNKKLGKPPKSLA